MSVWGICLTVFKCLYLTEFWETVVNRNSLSGSKFVPSQFKFEFLHLNFYFFALKSQFEFEEDITCHITYLFFLFLDTAKFSIKQNSTFNKIRSKNTTKKAGYWSGEFG